MGQGWLKKLYPRWKGVLARNSSHQSKLKIFLDLKLYDIPNTMATNVFFWGIDMLTIHASVEWKG